jgi:hypothetical protein
MNQEVGAGTSTTQQATRKHFIVVISLDVLALQSHYAAAPVSIGALGGGGGSAGASDVPSPADGGMKAPSLIGAPAPAARSGTLVAADEPKVSGMTSVKCRLIPCNPARY